MHLFDIPWDVFSAFIELIVHFDQHIHHWVSHVGVWIYFLSFLIITLETGVIIFPFLPGDSLLFTLGAVAASQAVLNLPILTVILILGATLGGIINYMTGSYMGPRIFQDGRSRSGWFRRSHLTKTQAFYEKHGGKTIVLARFLPIFRTFVPFVAGIGRMNYKRFSLFNFVGAAVWVIALILAGSYFGNIPIVKRNFGIVVPMVIIISILPLVFEFFSKQFRKNEKKG
ncbi:MAG: associated Golgi protein-like protein [Bacteriovoracaceae bacterium]|nr:associated Golgi protein-like protein [Bacteriovoracaceae bacterium]